jgi:hypothetical protein
MTKRDFDMVLSADELRIRRADFERRVRDVGGPTLDEAPGLRELREEVGPLGLGAPPRVMPFEQALHQAAGLPPPRAPRTITNTTEEIASGDGAMAMVLSLLSGDQEQAILGQERQGQAELVGSTVLPTDIQGDGRRALEVAGVVFGKRVAGDPMFTEATLPEGWRKVATSHDMWSDLLDDLGRVRARIFYKASWHDRSSHMSVEARYGVRTEYEKRSGECAWHENGTRAVVLDGGHPGSDTRLFATAWQYPKKGNDRWHAPEPRKEAETWLAKHFPRHKEPNAYWDDPVGPASRNAVKRQASADARRLVAYEPEDVHGDSGYAKVSFQRRVSDLAKTQVRLIAKPWRPVYLAAFVATAEHGRQRRVKLMKGAGQ